MKKFLLFSSLFLLLTSAIMAQAVIRLVQFDPLQETVTVKNVGNSALDITNYQFCLGPGQYNSISNYTSLTGDLDLSADEEVTIDLTSGSQNVTALPDANGALGLFANTSFSSNSPDDLIDFVQWGAGNQNRVGQAVTAGRWDSANNFISGEPPYTFTGDAADVGPGFWESTVDEAITYIAQLSGSQEVLPVNSTGQGLIEAVLDGNQLTVSGTFDRLIGDFDTNIGAHIHMGVAGKNGGVVLVLSPTLDADGKGGSFEAANNTFQLTQGQIDTLQTRGYYVNIHSTRNPSGEIRGQLLPDADAYFHANLFGSSEVPAVMSQGAGSLLFELHDDTLIATGSWAGLSSPIAFAIGGGAHIHQAPAGRNAGIAFLLNFSADMDTLGAILDANNVFVLNADQQAALLNDEFYINIHSENFTGGELRGQVLPLSVARFIIELSANQEVLPQLSFAHGKMVASLDANNNLTLSGTYNELESDLNVDIVGGAHIHGAQAGENGGIKFVLTPSPEDNRNGTFNTVDNTFTLNEGQVDSLLARQLYVNIHSLDIPSGELRGQVLPEAQIYFLGQLSGAQEVQPVISQGSGTIITELLGTNLTFTGSVRNINSGINTNILGGMHLHTGMAGENGPVEIPLNINTLNGGTAADLLATDNQFAVTQGLIDTIRRRGTYFNVHSFAVGSGEVRGQALPFSRANFYSNLAGSHEIPAQNSTAFGVLTAEYTGNTLVISGSLDGLSSPIATEILGGGHLHLGDAGTNGPVSIPLNLNIGSGMMGTKLMAADNAYDVTTGQLDSIRNRQTYFNFHTANFQSGEIRGQLLPYAQSVFTTSLSGDNENPAVASTGTGGMKFELVGNQLKASGSFANLSSDYNMDIGSHIHFGDASQNGPVLTPFAIELDPSQRAGAYAADQNVFDLTEGQLDTLVAGGLYVNIHSVDSPSGELRGQILNDANQFPIGTMVFSPEDNAEVTLDGLDTPFEALWMPSVDPDDNLQVYDFELGLDTAFTLTLFRSEQGTDTLFATTFGVVDTLLAQNGVGAGNSISIFHRVVSSDGSVQTAGPSKRITLTRDETTAVNTKFQDAISWVLSPVPFRDQLVMNINADLSGNSRSVIYNQNGQAIFTRQFQLNKGQNTLNFELSELSAGFYVVALFIEGELAGFQKVVKE